MNIERDKIDEEAEILNKKWIILEVAAYNREWLHIASSTQQMEQMRADLNEKIFSHEEKLKNLESKFEWVKDECDLELVGPRKINFILLFY